jgi:hypothetical protein
MHVHLQQLCLEKLKTQGDKATPNLIDKVLGTAPSNCSC